MHRRSSWSLVRHPHAAPRRRMPMRRPVVNNNLPSLHVLATMPCRQMRSRRFHRHRPRHHRDSRPGRSRRCCRRWTPGRARRCCRRWTGASLRRGRLRSRRRPDAHRFHNWRSSGGGRAFSVRAAPQAGRAFGRMSARTGGGTATCPCSAELPAGPEKVICKRGCGVPATMGRIPTATPPRTGLSSTGNTGHTQKVRTTASSRPSRASHRSTTRTPRIAAGPRVATAPSLPLGARCSRCCSKRR
mmetsp:Transcript_56823/g.184085  ORF Transcript_56823/g.184085 Transcript_56823/m.184085 type:complete len:244 (+) Transcript_56823:283-1014(+)